MGEVSRAFFDLPLAEKMRVARPARDVARGYIGLDEESLARSRDPSAYGSDLNESLMIGPVDPPDAAYANAPAGRPALRAQPLARGARRACARPGPSTTAPRARSRRR